MSEAWILQSKGVFWGGILYIVQPESVHVTFIQRLPDYLQCSTERNEGREAQGLTDTSIIMFLDGWSVLENDLLCVEPP